MNRRTLMMLAGGLPLMSTANAQDPKPAFHRSRPGDPSWPSAAQWNDLKAEVGGQLVEVHSPLEACRRAPESAECAALFRGLKNPWYIGDNVALTQTSGWVDAWTSAPSAYAVAARNAADVVAAVELRAHAPAAAGGDQGGGHSYQEHVERRRPRMLVWTTADGSHRHPRRLSRARSCSDAAQPAAVSISAGASWLRLCRARRQGRPLRAGRRLPWPWAWPGLVPEAAARQLLQALRLGGRQPDRGRGGDGGRRRAHRQRLHQPRSVLGA